MMTSLYRVRTEFTGFSGGPGVATMYALDVDTFTADLHIMFDALKPHFPPPVHINIQTQGDIIDDTSGTITGAWGADPLAEIVGSGEGHYPAPVGSMIRWNTATILDGKRLRGHTFLVPLIVGAYTNGGVVDSGYVTTQQEQATAFSISQSASFVVWHRPRLARAETPKLKALTAHDGGHGLVTGATVSNKVAVLRSRRD